MATLLIDVLRPTGVLENLSRDEDVDLHDADAARLRGRVAAGMTSAMVARVFEENGASMEIDAGNGAFTVSARLVVGGTVTFEVDSRRRFPTVADVALLTRSLELVVSFGRMMGAA